MVNEEAIPTLYKHASRMYEIMESQSELTEKGYRVWRGSLVKIVSDELNLSNPYYTKIVRTLRRMKCIHQLQRGGGGRGSVWQLLQPPSMELLQEYGVEPWDARNPESQGRNFVVMQRQDDMTTRLSRLEDVVEGLLQQVMRDNKLTLPDLRVYKEPEPEPDPESVVDFHNLVTLEDLDDED